MRKQLADSIWAWVIMFTNPIFYVYVLAQCWVLLLKQIKNVKRI